MPDYRRDLHKRIRAYRRRLREIREELQMVHPPKTYQQLQQETEEINRQLDILLEQLRQLPDY